MSPRIKILRWLDLPQFGSRSSPCGRRPEQRREGAHGCGAPDGWGSGAGAAPRAVTGSTPAAFVRAPALRGRTVGVWRAWTTREPQRSVPTPDLPFVHNSSKKAPRTRGP